MATRKSIPSPETIALLGAQYSQGLRYRLFEMDELLSGRQSPIRLKADQYQEARRLIVELHELLRGAQFEASPQAVRKPHAREASTNVIPLRPPSP